MSATLLRVEPVQFQAASRVIGETVADRVLTAVWQLVDALGASAGMAGSDPAGVSWGEGYDRAADAVTTVSADVVRACFRLAALLQQTGLNYGRAESASAPGVGWVEDRNDYVDRSVVCPMPPSAVGAGCAAPTGWSLVEQVVGYLWPNGHQDRLHTAAAAWRAFAEAIDCAAEDVLPAVAAVAGQVAPEVANAEVACRDLRTHLHQLAATGASLSRACEEYAAGLDSAHSQVEHELVSLLEWTAAIEAAGAVGAIFTFGASEAAAQAVETSRIAATAVRIAEIIQKLGTLARAAAQYVANIGYDIGRITIELNPLLTSRIAVAMVETRGGLATAREVGTAETQLGRAAPEIAGFGVSDLEAAANAIDRNGLTKAGRALQKHGDRTDSAFSQVIGPAAARNGVGLAQVRAILCDPQRRIEVLDNVINVYGADGRGVRYTRAGAFMGFLEP